MGVMRRKRRRKRNKKSFKSPPHLQYQLKIATKHVNLRVSPTLITPKKSYRRYKTTIIRKKADPLMSQSSQFPNHLTNLPFWFQFTNNGLTIRSKVQTSAFKRIQTISTYLKQARRAT